MRIGKADLLKKTEASATNSEEIVRTYSNEYLQNVYRRYLRIRLDAIIECYDLLKNSRNAHQAMETMKKHIYKFSEVAYDDVMKPMIELNKKRGLKKNYIKG